MHLIVILLSLAFLTLYSQAEDIALWGENTSFITYEVSDVEVKLDDGSLRVTKVENPSLLAFPVANTRTPNSAVLVMPGGGYSHLAYGKEGTEVATWLNSIGVSAFVLKYRIPNNREGAFQDAQRAMRFIRHHATKWNIDPNKIGVLGFSAGGHLAARLSGGYSDEIYTGTDEIDSKSARPDFSMLVYPAYLEENGVMNPDLKVGAESPPTLLIHNHKDELFIKGSQIYYKALKNQNTMVKVHIFDDGKHGYGLRLHPKMKCATWPHKAQEWLHERSLVRMEPANNQVKQLEKNETIVFFGDSITQDGAKPGGYVDLVSKELATGHQELNATVIGAGVSGNKTGDLLKRLNRDVLRKQPSTVVIYIGINDVWHWTKPHPKTKKPREGTTAHDYASDLRQLITRIHASNARVILCTPSVIGEKVDPANEDYIRLEEYAAISRNIAKETGSQLIDLRKAFIDHLQLNNKAGLESGVLTDDKVHMNSTGNQLIADEILIGLGLKERVLATGIDDASKENAIGFYLCIGQSNMAGRARLLDKDHGEIKNVYLLDDSDQWSVASNPLNRFSTIRKGLKMQQLSPASSFAQEMSKRGGKVGLIVNAKGGSSIKHWAKDTEFYKEAIRRVKAAEKNGVLLGIIWHQGEADYQDADYLDKLVSMVKSFRRDLNMPQLPFVAGQINNVELINQQLEELPKKLKKANYVSSKGLTATDQWHFDHSSTIELGERYAEAMKELQKQ